MPLEEKEMETVFELKCKYFLKKMEVGKFYSYDEMKELILTSSHDRPQLSPIDKTANTILDIAYVEAVIQAQYAVGALKGGEKNGQRYYAKI